MPARPEDLLNHLENLGISITCHDHAAVMTVAQSRALRGDIDGLHAKNLLLKDKKGRLWLVVVEERRTLDLKQLRKRLGASNLSFASADVLEDALGVTPGSVTPFALINDTQRRVALVLDQALAMAPAANFHPLTNTQTVTLPGAGLLTFLNALDITPDIIDFGA